MNKCFSRKISIFSLGTRLNGPFFHTACQNGFRYKFFSMANNHQNLKQNSNKMTMKRNPLRQNVLQLNFCLQSQKLVVMTHVLKEQLFIMLSLWLQRSV